MHLQKLLEEHNYDTTGNFIDFYENFQKSRCNSVLEFFHLYSPPITSEHYNCVGLALELWNRLTISLEKKYPGIGNHICVVSCEEDIDSTPSYVGYNVHESGCYRLEKEHALMCLKVEFRGRVATLLCDPGYHVSRVVAITSDGAYPNTGWFVQSEENGITKEYNYSFVASDKNFVEWKERTTSNGKEKHFTGVIYVGRPFLTAVDVTERRNLVYNFRSILSRDQKGHLIAGVYFKVALNNDEFTIFYQNMGKQRIKMNFSAFCKPLVNPDLLEKLTVCNEQLNLPDGKLLTMIRKIGQILNDTKYLPQLLDIDRCISILSANN